MNRAAVAAALSFFVLATTVLPAPRSAVAAVSSRAAGAVLSSPRLDAAVLALERYYRAENAGAADAYIERAQRAGLPVGTSERCRLPSGASSTRPTVLANPPLAESAIRQRGALFAVVGAYANLAAAVANRSGAAALAASRAQRIGRAQLVARAADLRRAAAVHAQGDLFLEDEAHALNQALAGPASAAGGVVRRLGAILASDLNRQRSATIAATTLAYDIRISRNHTATGPVARRTTGVPACSEPPIFDAGAYGAARSGPPARTDSRALRLRRRLDAAHQADPRVVLQSMLALADDASRAHEVRLACAEANFARAATSL